MKVRGHGGFWVLSDSLYGGVLNPITVNTIVHNAEYTVLTVVEKKRSRTPSGKGWGERLPVWRDVEKAFFRVAEDDVSYPQVLGFTEGKELTVYLKRGALNEWDKITATLVESVHIENDQKKARWAEISCAGGRYERLVAAPTLPGGV